MRKSLFLLLPPKRKLIELFLWPVHCSYALVLAATLLTGGRLADIWSAKWIFIGGFAFLGVTSLVIPFISQSAIFSYAP